MTGRGAKQTFHLKSTDCLCCFLSTFFSRVFATEMEKELDAVRAERDQVRSALFAAKHRLLAELDASHVQFSSLLFG